MGGFFDSDPFGTDPLFGDLHLLLGRSPEPPDALPLRILGLSSLPRDTTVLAAVFRKRVLETHPDGDPFDPANVVVREILKHSSEFQEVVWARDVLKRKTPRPVGERAAPTEAARCSACGEVIWYGGKPHPHPAPGCKGCKGKRDTSPEHWRSNRLKQRGFWEGYCEWCAHELELEWQRERRRQRRADMECDECGDEFTPRRIDARFCSAACRQRAYRLRVKNNGGAS